MFRKLPTCPFCYGTMSIQEVACKKCDIRMRGDFLIHKIARLSGEEQKFIENFVLCGGSLKELGTKMKVSYPTIRAKLDRVIESLGSLGDEVEERKQNILSAIESGKISAEEGATLIKELEQ